MIIVDTANLFFAAASVTKEPSEIAGIMLGKIRAINVERRQKYGSIVLCGEGGSWRKKIFPYYKGKRAEMHSEKTEESKVEFETLMKTRDWLWENLEKHSPWPCIRVSGAEGDDLIASIVLNESEPHLIVSGDKDMTQLVRFDGVSVWHPFKKQFVDNGKDFWKHLVLRGDPGDGVPNILSDDDVFMNAEKRQKPITAKFVAKMVNAAEFKEAVITSGAGGLSVEELDRNFERNRQLVDLTQIPSDLMRVCMQRLNAQQDRKKRDLIPLFLELGCANFVTRAAEFRAMEKALDI